MSISVTNSILMAARLCVPSRLGLTFILPVIASVLISLMRQQIDDSGGKLNFELQNWASFLRKPVAINLLEIPVLRRPVSY